MSRSVRSSSSSRWWQLRLRACHWRIIPISLWTRVVPRTDDTKDPTPAEARGCNVFSVRSVIVLLLSIDARNRGVADYDLGIGERAFVKISAVLIRERAA